MGFTINKQKHSHPALSLSKTAADSDIFHIPLSKPVPKISLSLTATEAAVTEGSYKSSTHHCDNQAKPQNFQTIPLAKSHNLISPGFACSPLMRGQETRRKKLHFSGSLSSAAPWTLPGCQRRRLSRVGHRDVSHLASEEEEKDGKLSRYLSSLT